MPEKKRGEGLGAAQGGCWDRERWASANVGVEGRAVALRLLLLLLLARLISLSRAKCTLTLSRPAAVLLSAGRSLMHNLCETDHDTQQSARESALASEMNAFFSERGENFRGVANRKTENIFFR